MIFFGVKDLIFYNNFLLFKDFVTALSIENKYLIKNNEQSKTIWTVGCLVKTFTPSVEIELLMLQLNNTRDQFERSFVLQ